ncbi:MAG: hypothetical protein JWQ83_804 [Lacunisphaera sp.]|jgi:hypothetical protein|nr:hypothetical protein [Lacunisphaera sp.]MDB6165664.1 hypothetical protein [Lacunisphaera sp.]
MDATGLTHLNGQSVLVKSTADRHDPPTALRGTIEARTGARGQPVVKIVLEYPDMFNTAAHRGVIVLDAAGIERLAASEHDGVFAYTIDRPLDPGPEPVTPQDSE